MLENKDDTTENKDIDFYIRFRDFAYDYLINSLPDDCDDDKELKKIKLILDIGDKAIQNRIRAILNLEKIEINEENDMDEIDNEFLSDLLFEVKETRENDE